MSTTVITDIGTLVTGDLTTPPVSDTTLVVEDGVITAIGDEPVHADVAISANGLTVIPGLIDAHVHPTFGEWTPAQSSIGWLHNYVQGGTTSMVSAGELHVPGLDFGHLDPDLVTSLALLSRETTGRIRQSSAKAHVGTLLLVPGLTTAHFDRLAERDVRNVKFIFYDWARLDDGEARQYVEWAHERGMVVKMHSGGVSRSGASRVTGYEIVHAVRPDVVAHISGGPIPMPDHEIRAVIDDVPHAGIEVCSSMNYRATMVTTEHLAATGQLTRLTLGTDTPGGTGVIPRGMLRNICYLASVCGLDPVTAIAAATGNSARLYGLAEGLLEPGRPADLVALGPVQGSLAGNALDSFARGDLPGIGLVMIDGLPVVFPRSEQTPPPSRLPYRLTLR
ncbi:amidohydrolase family protein [Amycolatopsis jejuensis]|uniref:amidohydrolase family protein n=1 Tax=Amycolatopsis jejuensis TaxID=330084 RepID=UPI000524BD73|nr:amidohydrolase family protein [Amycolatopsis jejuensis]